MKKVIFIQGEIKFTPKLKPDKVAIITNSNRLHNFDSTANSISLKHPVFFPSEAIAFDELGYIFQMLREKKLKYRGEIFSLTLCRTNHNYYF